MLEVPRNVLKYLENILVCYLNGYKEWNNGYRFFMSSISSVNIMHPFWEYHASMLYFFIKLY